jgi:hypothetical protein
MRAGLVLSVVLAGGVARASAPPVVAAFAPDEGSDDPKCARGECRPPRFRPLDEDDPKLARGQRRRHLAPAFEVGYRFLQIADPFGGALPFHHVEIDAYPVSGIFRLGLSLGGGAASRYEAWMCLVGLSAGLQYPARVTPFLDFRFVVGVVGATLTFANSSGSVEKPVVSYAYVPALEGGISVYLASRFHLTVALGWAHPVYGGVDANAVQQQYEMGIKPTYDIKPFGFDTATVRVGLGF